ncbi:MAG: hypothetical protein WC080_03025 [Patescibacteria group bacterium]
MSDRNLLCAREILEKIYLSRYIFLSGLSGYDTEAQSAIGTFVVPTSEQLRYTAEQLGYVSATERHSCVNQLAYSLTALLVRDHAGQFACYDLESFRDLSSGFQMWNTKEHFEHKKVLPRDTEFEISMHVTRSRISPHGLSVVEVELNRGVDGYVHFAVQVD